MSTEMKRRDFLRGAAWMGAVAFAAGCRIDRLGFGEGGSMQDFALSPIKRIRVGYVGIGSRGTPAGRICRYHANGFLYGFGNCSVERGRHRRGGSRNILHVYVLCPGHDGACPLDCGRDLGRNHHAGDY